MKKILQSGITKKLMGIAVAGAFAFAPGLGTIPVQADPPSHAPAYGRRDKDHKNHKKDKYKKDHKSKKDRGRYDRNSRNNRYQTISGIVTRDHRGDEFTVRMPNGRTIRVDANGREPRRLNEGDHVRIYGRYVNNVFSANNIVITSNRSHNDRDYRYDRNDRHDRDRGNDYRSYTGIVTNIRSSRAFDIYADGKTYNVTLSSNAPRSLDRNDYVRVYGKRMGKNNINNANVAVLRNR
jgi:hypothetical protein